MLYAVICTDKEESAELRSRTRRDHLHYLEPFRDRILFAGPFLRAGTEDSDGGLIVIDLPDMDAANAFAQNDPYAVVGLFARVDVREWRKVIPA